MTSLLLTGATGLVGSRLLPRLAKAGFDCRALVRGDAALPPGVAAVRGDLADADSLQPAVDGVEAVVHLAALFRTGDEDAIWRVNLDGTRNLIAAVEAHAPAARFVMAGNPIERSAEPLANPWSGRMDTTLARRLGFRPTVPTIHAAAREGIL